MYISSEFIHHPRRIETYYYSGTGNIFISCISDSAPETENDRLQLFYFSKIKKFDVVRPACILNRIRSFNTSSFIFISKV